MNSNIRAAALAGGALWLALAAGQAMAKVDAAEAAKLGKDLTPVGAEKGANAAGTIPAWTPAKQLGALSGEYPTNPEYDAEKPLFTITKENMAKYAEQLDEGHKKLLSSFPTYKMNVYPSHRPVKLPDEIEKATIANATTAVLDGTDVLKNATVGYPFPIPKSGAEPIWNHRLKWRGETARRYNNQMIVQPNGEFQLTKIIEDVKFYYSSLKSPVPADKGSVAIKYLSQTLAPPRMAGTFILVHEKTDTRDAWLYSPALKRIRRAPTVCCDNPYEGTDGHQFYDQVDMFNGILERYNWKLVGKKEMYIPYNSNLIAGPKVKYKDLAKPKHLNQDLPRYELHRVWVVDATIKPGTSHTFARRQFYLDEDSWNIVAVENYDSRGQLYQYQEGHLVYAYNVQTATTIPEVIYHLTSGRYFITAMANEDKAVDSTASFDDKDFDPAVVQKRTTK
jgi:hypothetical protein